MSSEQLAAAEALADAVERARAALGHGSLTTWARCLMDVFVSLDAYRQADEAPAPAPAKRKKARA